MGKKITLIIISVVSVIALLLLIFLNSKIKKADPKDLGAPHYIGIDDVYYGNIDLNISNVFLNIRHLPLDDYLEAPNGEMYNYTATLELYKVVGYADLENNITFLFNLPSGLENQTNVFDKLVYVDFGFEYPFRLPLTLITSNMPLVIDGEGNYINVVLEAPSKFLFELDGKNLINLINYSVAVADNYRSEFEYIDGDFTISDVGDMIFDLFIGYPRWLLSLVGIPLGWLGGGLSW